MSRSVAVAALLAMGRRTIGIALASVLGACAGPPVLVPREDAGPDAGRDAAVLPPLDVPIVEVGIDAYRHWERWPALRVGTRTIMRSTYDRTGGNETVDASHFLRADAADRWVTFDVEGPGALVFARTNHWHGSPWHYQIDGDDLVVTETSTADPENPVEGSVFMPEATFPAPLALTWSTTRGADLSWVPIPFEETFTLAYERTFYGTGYDIAQVFPVGAENLSRPIASFDRMPPPPEAIALFERAGSDLSPPDATPTSGTFDLAPGEATTVAELEGSRTVRMIRITAPRTHELALGRSRIAIRWDDRVPSVDAPVALFFGAGTIYDREGDDEWLVRAIPVAIHFVGGEVELSAYWPMPFFERARVELTASEAIPGVRVEVRTVPYDGPRDHVGYFHATFVDHPAPVDGEDLVLLDTDGLEGSPTWCGHFVGTSFIFSDTPYLGTLEGDPRFYFDGARSPQAYGTGTEEWGGGGDYWGGRTMTLPLAGHPVGAPEWDVRSDEDRIESAYRFLLADAFPFGRRARIQLEHGALDTSDEHYRTVTMWYGLPGACLAPSDAVDVGDPASEAAHAYASSPSEVEIVRSVWDAGPLVQAESIEDGRVVTESEMVVSIDPRNHGVLLRRTLDYAIADQRAEVWVGDADDPSGALELAGVWLTAGSTRTVHSYAESELGPPRPVLQDPMRRLRDDELLIAPRHTRGRSRLRIRFVHAPRPGTPWPRPLLPGEPAPPGGWSELRYEVLGWTLPVTP